MKKDRNIKSALSINKGVPQPPSINPVLQNGKVRRRRKKYSADEYIEGIISGDISMLSQAITLVESSLREHYELAQQIIEKCLPYSTKSVRIGITGVPGAGKSTFIEALGLELADQGRRVAVLAIDPSSTNTRGSILGDKTRMEKLGTHPNAFIRPSPSAGTLGGVA
ncbi:MAG TPA: ATP/GTP-binding protein, partial [Bacteroidales bacterium]|nr:ATP/GTP-binding protein [Bacteroidales bacterium]